MTDATATLQFELVNLCDLPHLAAECARLNDAEWGDGSADSLDMRNAGFRRLALDGDREGVILALVTSGENEGKLAGFCALIENDLPAFEELRPWLATLIVAPEFRGYGLAKPLIHAIEDMARENGESELFLHSKIPDLYRACGYANIESYEKGGETRWVLGKLL